MENLQEFITAGQAAKIAGYNPDYLSSLIRAGKIKGKKVGKNWVTSRQELNRYIKLIGGKPAPIVGSSQNSNGRRTWNLRSFNPTYVIIAVISAGLLALASYGAYASIYNQALNDAQNGTQASSTLAGTAASTAAADNVVTSLPQL